MSANLGFLEAFLGLNTAGFTAGIHRAQKSMAIAGRSMQRTGKTMSAMVSLPLALAGGAAIKMAVDFEKSFSKIEGLVGISSDKVQAFRKDVMALAGPTAQAPEKLAEAMFFVTSAGLRGADALDVLTMSAKAAAANVGDVAVIADLVTSATNAYGIEMLTAAEATDTLVAAVREGKRPPEEIANSIGRVLPVASEMGVSFQEVGASIAAMSRTGTDAAEAVTGLRQILFSILNPSEGAEKAFVNMGTSAFQLKEMLGSEGGLIKLLEFLRENTSASSNAFSEAFPNVRALAGALDIMGKNAEANKQIFANMTDNTGDLDKALAAAAKTTDFKMKQAMANLKVASIQLGEILIPIFSKLVEWVTKATTWFSSLSTETKRVSVAFGLVALAAGPMITLLGFVATAIGAITWPIVAVIAAVAALGVAFSVLYANWEAMVERVSDWSWWKNMLLDMVISFDRFLSGIVKDINYFISFFTDWEIPNIFEDWIKELEEMKDPAKEFEHQFVGVLDSIKKAANDTKSAISGLFDMGGGGGAAQTAAASSASSKTKPSGPVLNLPVIDWEKMWGGADGWKTKLQPGTFKKEMEELRGAALNLGDAVQNSLNNAFVELGETLGDIFSGDAGASSFFETITHVIASFMKTLGQAAIAAGVAGIAFQNLFLNPYALVAAGIALVAASVVLTNVMKKGPKQPQGLRSGGFVNEGGVFQLHKDELVTLPNGSAVTPAGMARGSNQNIIVHGEISGRVIKLIYDEENRITGNSN
jgi:TP901 family phage tail tape measure protein